MKSRMLLSLAALLTCCSLAAWSQDSTKASKAPTKAAAGAEEKKPTNRLPSNYGKLGLTDAQKDKVYAVQDKYDKQLDDLEAQIKALKNKRDDEIEAVLSAEQKKILKDLTDEAKAKSKKSDDKEKK